MIRNTFFSIVLALAAAPVLAGSPEADITRADGWVSWQVPLVDGAGVMCCFGNFKRGAKIEACDLDGRNWSYGTSSDNPRKPGDSLTVYAHVDGGKVDRLRALSTSCPVRSKSEIRSIDVAPADSVAYLGRYAGAGTGGSKHDETDYALTAIAYHAEPAATAALAGIAAPGHQRDLRESALFWLGQLRGVEGAGIVERFATRDDDPQVREHAVFALSQSPVGDAYARILAIAGSDPQEDVRSKALFWMAQMGDARAEADILAVIGRDTSAEVREQAVFALSQLEKGADKALIAVIRGNYPRDVKEKALFWLGQSGSDEALGFMDEVLAKGEKR